MIFYSSKWKLEPFSLVIVVLIKYLFNFIKIVEEDNDKDLMIYMNKITSYYNDLRDENGFPKKFIK